MESQQRILQKTSKNKSFPFFPELSKRNFLLLLLLAYPLRSAYSLCSEFWFVDERTAHAFYVVFPVVTIYAFYCWSWLFSKKAWQVLAVVFILSGLVFHTGLAISRAPGHSLCNNRKFVVEALDKKDYRILGERRKGYY